MASKDCIEKHELTDEYLEKMNAYWRAANYLSAAQLYMLDNPLLREPLTREQVKKKIVGHWGTVPGQNFVYTHLNRVIKRYDLDMILISGPGHGGNFFVANSYLEGSYSEVYPNVSQDYEGMKKLCKQFSFPGGISSHVAPETPGSINEGGELGYSIAHAFGSVFDNPDLITACIVGDGEVLSPQHGIQISSLIRLLTVRYFQSFILTDIRLTTLLFLHVSHMTKLRVSSTDADGSRILLRAMIL